MISSREVADDSTLLALEPESDLERVRVLEADVMVDGAKLKSSGESNVGRERGGARYDDTG